MYASFAREGARLTRRKISSGPSRRAASAEDRSEVLASCGSSIVHPDVTQGSVTTTTKFSSSDPQGFCRWQTDPLSGTIRLKVVGLGWDVLRISDSHSPNGPGRPLGTRSPEHDDTLGVDDQRLSRLSFGEPRELHDRPARRVEDDLLNLLDVALDAMARAAEDGDFRDRVHDGHVKELIPPSTATFDGRLCECRSLASGPRLSAVTERWQSRPSPRGHQGTQSRCER
jgi:hypothetical protein